MNTKKLIIWAFLGGILTGILGAQEPVSQETITRKTEVTEISDVKSRQIVEVQLNTAVLARVLSLQRAEKSRLETKYEPEKKFKSIDEIWKSLEESVDNSLDQ